MGLLKAASGGGYLKAGLLGFAGSGKTHTAIEMALGTREYFKLPGPIAIFDTEGGSDFWRSRVRERTGKDLMTLKSRSLEDLLSVSREAMEMGVSVLVIDSITHVWREVCDSYLRELQEIQRKNKWRVRDTLEFSDWGKIKKSWSAWPDLYLNAPMHMIVCGRAGYEYDMEQNEETKKRELIKTGIKMRVEGEFGFEPSLLVEMQRDFVTDRKGALTDKRDVINRAIILKDRFGLIDGHSCEDPTFKFFEPHIKLLDPGQHTTVDTSGKTAFQLDQQGRDEWDREKERRVINAEEIKSALAIAKMDGQGSDEKKARAEAFSKYWNSGSWTFISEKMPSSQQREGLVRFYKDHPEHFGDGPPPDELPEWAGGAAPNPETKPAA